MQERIETSDGTIIREVNEDGSIANVTIEVGGKVVSYEDFVQNVRPAQKSRWPARIVGIAGGLGIGAGLTVLVQHLT